MKSKWYSSRFFLGMDTQHWTCNRVPRWGTVWRRRTMPLLQLSVQVSSFSPRILLLSNSLSNPSLVELARTRLSHLDNPVLERVKVQYMTWSRGWENVTSLSFSESYFSCDSSWSSLPPLACISISMMIRLLSPIIHTPCSQETDTFCAAFWFL